ncbi:MAG: response regulator [Cephaloticoccus sp.]|nr:response regulator [Cephaloticoccus sp.]
MAGILTFLGVVSVLGWITHSDLLLQPLASFTPIKFNGAVIMLLLGLSMLGLELNFKLANWLALPPVLVCLATLSQYLLPFNWHIDELIFPDSQVIDTMHPGRVSPVTSVVFLLIGLALWGKGLGHKTRLRHLLEAIVGSIAGSAGFSTLLGYAAELPAIYNWGTGTPTSPMAALGMFLAGSAILVLAWRGTLSTLDGPPVWSPLPAVIACVTLTLVLWIGLRERELVYQGAKTQTAMDTLAIQINAELDRQTNDIEKIARRWGDYDKNNRVLWEADAITLLSSSSAYGCDSIAYLNPDLRSVWVFPEAGNEAKVSYDHGQDAVRAAALAEINPGSQQSAKATSAVVSGSTMIGGKGEGIVIYAPITRYGQFIGYVAGDYLYADFFRAIIADRVKIASDYYVAISIGGNTVYDSYASDQNRNNDLTLDRSYTIFDRRIRVSLTPSTEALERDRRYLPELALLSGFGITILLGLSVHLARNARTGQHQAELSNRKLVSENEERRRIEARLKISDERLRLALDSTQIGIFEWSVTEKQVYYSPGLWAMLGYDHSRMPATVEAWQSLIHPDDLPNYRSRIDAQLSGEAAFIEPEYRVRRHDDVWRWVYTRSKVVATANNLPTRIIGTVQDISDRREAEYALRQSQAEARKLSLVAAKTDNPVLISSPDGYIEWVNESFIRVMEYNLEEVRGQNPTELLVGPETNPRTVKQIRGAMAQGQGLATDLVNYSKSGRKYHLHLEVQPIYNDTGTLENFIAILTDITMRVATENQLRRAKTEADATSRAKSEFLASMSHEIRTPMNGVIGMTSLLMETPLNVEQRDFVNTIRTSGEALLTIINDILDFSKIESGKLELEHMPFDLALCLEEAFDLFALQASAKKLELTYHIESDVPPWIISDVTRLRQIIVNLVNNAVKFTPSGSISVLVSILSRETNGQVKLEFAVRDTGIGIPADRIDRLFKAFSQVDSSTTRKYGGTGLGLAISQRLSVLMGGDIRVESQSGEGSAFIFTIQVPPPAIPSDYELPPAPEPLLQGTILCVEDNEVTRRHIEAIFAQWKVPCVTAPDTATALQLTAQLPAPPALIIANIDETQEKSPLPHLQNLPGPRLLMLPFGQSAPTEIEGKQPFAVIYKPLKTANLIYNIRQLFNPIIAAQAAAKRQSTRRILAEEIPLDILLVEDNAVNQKVALRFLERLGYHADAVGNGLEAVTTVESRQFHLVLMDIQMPEMDGFEASRQIRRRIPVNRQPKIVALTANAMQGDRELCLAAGMDDYISKPVKLHEIDATIRRLFGTDSASPIAPQFDANDQFHI